jgi:hypothetical protein
MRSFTQNDEACLKPFAHARFQAKTRVLNKASEQNLGLSTLFTG